MGALIALAACGGEGKTPPADSAAVIDSTPTAAAMTMAVLLDDENVFALLDTAYAELIRMDSLAQKQTSNAKVREMAAASVSQNTLGRKAVERARDLLKVPPTLPDRDVIKDQRQVMDELKTKTAADFDNAYLDRVIKTRKDLIDEVDDALAGTRITQPSIKDLLKQVRANLEADKIKAEGLKSAKG